MSDRLFIPFSECIRLKFIHTAWLYSGYDSQIILDRLIRLEIKHTLTAETKANMNNKIHVGRAQKLRGKNAIFDIHKELSHSDEKTINFKISEIYSVSVEEADEIHINYHLDRILDALRERAEKNLLNENDLIARLYPMDVQESASEVSKGMLLERAAVDTLFGRIFPSEKSLDFYG